MELLQAERQIGRKFPRYDALDKVTGQAQFTVDVSFPGMLHAALVRSPVPRGRILAIDVRDALAMEGVKAVLTAEDLRLPPVSCKDLTFGASVRDQKVLAEGEVRFLGEPVAAVAAESSRIAKEAARRVRVHVEPEPAVLTLDEALAPDAPLVHREALEPVDGAFKPPVPIQWGKSNIGLTVTMGEGDVESQLRKAYRTFEDTYTFPATYQYAMEPFCTVAMVSEREIRVWSTQQHPYVVQRDLARMFGVPQSRIRILSSYLGGGFGSKAFTHYEPITIALAKATGRPVKLELDITESMLTSRRHGARAHVRSGVDAEGRILAFDVEIFLETGAYAMLGPMVTQKAASRALSGYRFPAYRARAHMVYLNTSPACSFRSIGGPQGAWALEAHLNRIAAELGIDPWELRRRHVAERGARFRPGRRRMDADLREDLDALKALAVESHRDIPQLSHPWRVGSGVALAVADPGAAPHSTALVRLAADGSVGVMAGSIEMGQGMRTVMQQVVAETLGVSPQKISVLDNDTGSTPFDAYTGASRSTVMNGLAVQKAVESIRLRIARAASEAWDCPLEDVTFRDGQVQAPDGRSRPIEAFVEDHFGPGQGQFLGVGEVNRVDFPDDPPFWEVAAGAATIAVDLETGRIRLLAYHSVADLGRVINRLTIEGQEEGAVMQGLGHTLWEALHWEGGQLIHHSIIDYRVPRMTDPPPIFRSAFVENEDGPGPFGAKGGGESAIVPVAGAVAGALHQATGVFIPDLPLTPERVWQALAAQGTAPDFSR